MILSNNKIPIPGELESIALERRVTSSSLVYDYLLKKPQTEVNLILCERVDYIQELLDTTLVFKDESYNTLKPEPDAYLRNVHYNIENTDVSLISHYVTSTYNRPDLPESIELKDSLGGGYTVYMDPTLTLETLDTIIRGTKYYNLIPGYRYFYQDDNRKLISFTLLNTRRFIWADNAVNIRDLGGIPTKTSGHIAYDKLIRGSEVDGKVIVASEDALIALNILGFTLDLDLRREDELNDVNQTTSLIASKYHRIPFLNFEDILNLTEERKAKIKEAFELVANEVINGGKVYFHCAWGYHRCGFLATLLEGILGATQYEIDKDYELSSFSPLGLVRRTDSNYRIGIKVINEQYDGSWIKFAIDCNISEELINSFRKAMIVEVQKSEITLEQEVEPQYYEVTYQELVDLKNNNQLIPGAKYRMIDFDTVDGATPDTANCSGIPDLPEWRSAYHHFDLVITALSTYELDCNVKAVHSARDTEGYFNNVDLGKWDLKYDINNDKSKYSWAVSNGKGVIYYMKDENNNELPYDFKNILFKYQESWHYTFNTLVSNVVIKPWVDDLGQHLNGNIFINSQIIKDCFFDFNTYNNIMKSDIINVKVGMYSNNNTLINLESVKLGLDNINVYLENFVDSNIGNECYNLELYGNNNVIIVGDFVFNKTGVAVDEYTKINNNIVYSSIEDLNSVTKIYYTNGDKKLVRISGMLTGNNLPNFNNIKEVEIGNSVTSIGDEAFKGCSRLTSVTIPNSVTSIGWDAFYHCFDLTSITIGSGVTSIGFRAFEGCTSLTSVTIPNSVTSIDGYAFYGCSGLTSVTLESNTIVSATRDSSSSMKSIFGNQVKEYIIGSDVTSIGNNAFNGCSSLTSVNIPLGVINIGSYTFNGCSSLTSVTIPSSVTDIGDYTFSYCTNLTSVTCLPVTPPISYNSLPPSVVTIEVPAQSVDVYISTSGWSNYASKIVAIQL